MSKKKKEIKDKPLDMKHLDIALKCSQIYKIINEANLDLSKLRDECDHPKTYIGDYQTHYGHIIENATICFVCNELLNTVSKTPLSLYTNEYTFKI